MFNGNTTISMPDRIGEQTPRWEIGMQYLPGADGDEHQARITLSHIHVLTLAELLRVHRIGLTRNVYARLRRISQPRKLVAEIGFIDLDEPRVHDIVRDDFRLLPRRCTPTGRHDLPQIAARD